MSRKTWDLGEIIYHAGLLFITKGESYFILSRKTQDFREMICHAGLLLITNNDYKGHLMKTFFL